jgi:CPA1 family monovalent cation:H+ antiporter
MSRVDVLVVVVLLVAGVTLLQPVADRLSVPGPVVMTLFGVALALAPGIHPFLIPPDVVLPLVLPPLLFAAAQRSSTKDFTENWLPLLGLAVGLVLVTTVAVAFAARSIDDTITVAAAVTLGAIVSPPDPVAATSVANSLGLPKRLVAILEGEGLLNDATALVLYAVAVSAATGSFAWGDGVRILALSVIAAPIVGFVFAWLTVNLLDRLEDPRSEVAITLVLPYAAFILIDELGGSGVLAVLVAGLYVGQHGGRAFSSSGFLAGTTVWSFADWLVSGLVFGLIGFELSVVLDDPGIPTYGVGVAAAVCIAAVLVRAIYILPLDWLVRLAPGRGSGHGWQEATVVAWAGMRGVVTLATALALPEDFPARPVIIFSAIAVVLVTLVGQGLTLPWVVRALDVRAEQDPDAEVEELRHEAAGAALERLDELVADGSVPPESADTLRERYERMLPRDWSEEPEHVRRKVRDARSAAQAMRAAERATVLEARSSGEVSAEAANRVLRDIEAREVRQQRRADPA